MPEKIEHPPVSRLSNGRYEFIERLGNRSYSETYLARDRLLQRLVSIQVIHSSSDDEIQAFKRWVGSQSSLRHPNIVPFLDVFEDVPAGSLYVVSVHVDGLQLADWNRSRNATPQDLAQLFLSLAEALDYIHRRGVIHRDISPKNILVDRDNRPHIIDFGLATSLPPRQGRDDNFTGTLPYASPEQVRGNVNQGSTSSDVFSLGMTFFEALQGKSPYPDVTDRDKLIQLLMHHQESIYELDESIPKELNRIYRRAVAPRAEERSTAAEMAADLRSWLSTKTGTLPAASASSAPVRQAEASTGRTSELSSSPQHPGKSANDDRFDCTAFSPSHVKAGATFLLQVFVHLHSKSDEAFRLATEFDAESLRRGQAALTQAPEVGDLVSFDLTLRGASADDVRLTLLWQGETAGVSYLVKVDDALVSGTVSGKIVVSLGTIPVAQISLIIRIASDSKPPLASLKARQFQNYFVSYASADRTRVCEMIRMLKPLGKSYRQDILDLDPGDRWKKRLYEFISECDATLLFWSNSAKRSKWVRKECRYCIETKGLDHIVPVILERPPPLPHPELADLHMNDKINYFMD